MDDEENRREDAEALGAAGVAAPRHPRRGRLADVAPDARRAGGRRRGARRRDRRRSSCRRQRHRRRRPRPGAAFVPIWRRPWMTMSGDTYGSSLLAALGVVNVFDAGHDRYPATTLEEAAAPRARPRPRPDRALPVRRAPPPRAAGGGPGRPAGRRPGPLLVGRPHAASRRAARSGAGSVGREPDERAVAAALGAPDARRPRRGRAARRRAGTGRRCRPAAAGDGASQRTSARSSASSSESTTNRPGRFA